MFKKYQEQKYKIKVKKKKFQKKKIWKVFIGYFRKKKKKFK